MLNFQVLFSHHYNKQSWSSLTEMRKSYRSVFSDIRLMFSSFSLASWKNRQKLTMVCSFFEKVIAFPPLDVLRVFCVQEKAFNLNLIRFSPQNVKIPVTVSL